MRYFTSDIKIQIWTYQDRYGIFNIAMQLQENHDYEGGKQKYWGKNHAAGDNEHDQEFR